MQTDPEAPLPLIYVSFPIGAALMARQASRNPRVEDTRSWRLLAPAVTCIAAAESVWWGSLVLFGVQDSAIQLAADVVYFMGFCLVAAFSLSVLRHRFQVAHRGVLERARYVVDGLLATSVVAFALMLFVFIPMATGPVREFSLTHWAYLVYALVDLLAVAAMLSVIASADRETDSGWELAMMGGVAMSGAASLAFVGLGVLGYPSDSLPVALVEVAWMAAYLMIARAAGLAETAEAPLGALRDAEKRSFHPLAWMSVAVALVLTAALLLTLPSLLEQPVAYWGAVAMATWVAGLLAARAAVLSAVNRALAAESATDPLTGVRNRRQFQALLRSEVARSERTGRPVSVALIDIDHFRQVNERLGHLGGDQRLQLAGSCIVQAMRVMDAACRIGGDEFGAVLPEADADEALLVCGRIAHCFASSQEADTLPSTMSMGLATYPEHGRTVEGLLRAADAALYHAKDTGRAQTAVFVPGMRSREEAAADGTGRPSVVTLALEEDEAS
jgi:diguanylate cyclase (GGDEF)-like protein